MKTEPEELKLLTFKSPRPFFGSSRTGQVAAIELLTNDLLALFYGG